MVRSCCSSTPLLLLTNLFTLFLNFLVKEILHSWIHQWIRLFLSNDPPFVRQITFVLGKRRQHPPPPHNAWPFREGESEWVSERSMWNICISFVIWFFQVSFCTRCLWLWFYWNKLSYYKALCVTNNCPLLVNFWWSVLSAWSTSQNNILGFRFFLLLLTRKVSLAAWSQLAHDINRQIRGWHDLSQSLCLSRYQVEMVVWGQVPNVIIANTKTGYQVSSVVSGVASHQWFQYVSKVRVLVRGMFITSKL